MALWRLVCAGMEVAQASSFQTTLWSSNNRLSRRPSLLLSPVKLCQEAAWTWLKFSSSLSFLLWSVTLDPAKAVEVGYSLNPSSRKLYLREGKKETSTPHPLLGESPHTGNAGEVGLPLPTRCVRDASCLLPTSTWESQITWITGECGSRDRGLRSSKGVLRGSHLPLPSSLPPVIISPRPPPPAPISNHLNWI